MSSNPLLERSPHAEDAGELIGRQPRKLAPEDFRQAEVPLLLAHAAIRAKCLDCCAGQMAEVRKCVATSCPLWAFRVNGRLPPKLKAAALGKDAGTSQGAGLAEQAAA